MVEFIFPVESHYGVAARRTAQRERVSERERERDRERERETERHRERRRLGVKTRSGTTRAKQIREQQKENKKNTLSEGDGSGRIK